MRQEANVLADVLADVLVDRTINIDLSDEGLEASIATTAINEYGERVGCHVAAARALTLYLDPT